MGRTLKGAWIAVGLVAVAAGWALLAPSERGRGGRARPRPAVAVEALTTGRIAQTRTYSGALEAPARFVVAPKRTGRLERLHFDLGDAVPKGAVVAELDDDELAELVVQARAELAVAKARAVEVKSAAGLAERQLERQRTLRERGVVSASQLDAAAADFEAKTAALDLAVAEVDRANAALEAARVRLADCRLVARWRGEDERRVVGERFVDEGTTVAANAPIVSLVTLDPLTAVISVPERDYRFMKAGLPAVLHLLDDGVTVTIPDPRTAP